MSEEQGQWLECVVDNDYEIWSEYPHPIRRKGSNRISNGWIDKTDGYIRCSLNGKHYLKHRINAEQFIENDDPEHNTQVDHINHDKTDNRIENLRWVSPLANIKNRTGNKGITYDYFDEIPCETEDDIIEVRDYKEYQFEDLYYCNDYFYFWNGLQFRRLHINYLKTGYAYIIANDIDGQSRSIYYSKFKKLYDLM